MNYIIVPYRDRDSDYNTFNAYMPGFLTKIFESRWKIVIVEQAAGKDFNRGTLLNIGFLLCDDVSGNYFLHDIDTLPASETAQGRYTLDCSTRIIGIYNSVCDTLGGIVKISGAMFAHMNGFPNNYFGWGVEDKALQNRAYVYDYTVDKLLLNNESGSAHFAIGNNKPAPRPSELGNRTHYEYNIFPTYARDMQKSIILRDGLNNCKYSLISEKHNGQIHHYVVEF
jgi:hypothetical protein